ncbi:hypothetical protein [Pseudomonas sp. RL_5y_Pfl2_69]|uniref:hypothetical protein n=1 Tax=Pseudomonas sp. RL_5y_Pfl2_69 TaxID=3088711 RepID=UPI0030D86366
MTSIGFYKGGIYPYESLVGIILNTASFHKVQPSVIVKLIGTRSGRNKITEYYHPEAVEQDFITQALATHAVRCFPRLFMLSNFSHGLKFKFCGSCLKLGYHAVFFCLPQVNSCIVHREQLIEACERCQNFKTIDIESLPCVSCGFQMADVSDQIHYRKDIQLKLKMYHAFSVLDRWYSNIVRHVTSGSALFLSIDKMGNYDVNPIDATFIRALGWPLPLTKCDETIATRKARIVRWVTTEKFHTALDWIEACQHLERKHFRAQCPHCEGMVEQFSGYWDGKKLSHTLCIKSVVYFLLRIRFACLSQSSIPVGGPQQMGFEYLLVLEHVQPTKYGFPAALIGIYFLKLLYNLSIYLNLGYSVRVRLLPWEGLLYDLSLPGRREGEGVTVLGGIPLSKAFYCRKLHAGKSGVCFGRSDNYGWTMSLTGDAGGKSIVLNL